MKLAMAVCAMAIAGAAAAKPLAVGPLGPADEWSREVVIRAAAFDPSWNMVKVIRRGEDDSDESVVVHPKGTYTYLSIR